MSNIKTIQDIYEAFGRGDVEFIVDRLTDDVDWASEAEPGVAPWHGAHHGRGEVPNFFKALAETAQVTEFTPLSFAEGESDVMVVIRFGITVPATGKSGTMHLHHWWRFRDGKVCYYRGSEDTALTAELLAA